jgi:hypothetical protein
MSSTARWWQREPTDYYATPQGAIVTFLDAFLQTPEGNKLMQPYPEEKLLRTDLKILDPCAGWNLEPKEYVTQKGKSIMYDTKMAYPTVLSNYWAVNIVTNDIRDDSPATYHEDFTLYKFKQDRKENAYDLVISNPPFAHAEAFITNSLICAKEWGIVVMLLRLNFFGSQKRKAFWEKNMPTYTFVHRERMWFTPDGCTDSIEYIHAVWIKGQNPEFSKLKII